MPAPFLRAFALATTAALLSAVPALAAAPDPAIEATIKQFATALEKEDSRKIAALCTKSSSVVDEFPPYAWSGPNACATWFAGFGKFAASIQLANAHVKLGNPQATEIAPGRAYVVIPAGFTATMKGKPISEKGTWSFVLTKVSGAWRIVAHSWGRTAANF